MQPYNKLNKCPKCGDADPGSIYIGFAASGNDEYISRRCFNCRYVWRELPLDVVERYSKPTIKFDGLVNTLVFALRDSGMEWSIKFSDNVFIINTSNEAVKAVVTVSQLEN